MSTETKKAIVVTGFCLGPGRGDVFEGEKIELDPFTYRIELQRGRIKPVPPGESELKVQALAEARQDLLDKIAQAPTMPALEALLTEDPEIVAAYEKRLSELEETNPRAALLEKIRAAVTTEELAPIEAEIPEDDAELLAAYDARELELEGQGN